MFCELALLDRGQRLGHAVDEGLDADESRARMLRGLGDQMLAAAEAAFQPHVVHAAEQRTQIGGRGLGQIDRELRQQCVDQRGLRWRRGWPLRRPKNAPVLLSEVSTHTTVMAGLCPGHPR